MNKQLKGNGNYLGQEFEGVQPCPKCGGKGLLNLDGSTINSFLGLDKAPAIPCMACYPEPLPGTEIYDEDGIGHDYHNLGDCRGVIQPRPVLASGPRRADARKEGEITMTKAETLALADALRKSKPTRKSSGEYDQWTADIWEVSHFCNLHSADFDRAAWLAHIAGEAKPGAGKGE